MAEETTMNIYEKLSHIQNEMNVPKDKYNKFGNFYYRNAETILEVSKKVCQKYRTTLTIDDYVEVKDNGSTYIKSIATLLDWDSDMTITNVSYAKEPSAKKGMDDSQITGATISYCRKYCLGGLFGLDDSKDADAQEVDTEVVVEQVAMITDAQKDELYRICEHDKIFQYLQHYGFKSIDEMPANLAQAIIAQRREHAKVGK